MTNLWDGTGVTVEALKAEVIRLAEEFPDQLASCIYTRTTWDSDAGMVVPVRPVCIVGTAVYNLTNKFVPETFEGTSINGARWRRVLGLPPTTDAFETATKENSSEDFLFVLRVQRHQDDDNSWGTALTRASAINYSEYYS